MRRLTLLLSVVLCVTCGSPVPTPSPSPTSAPTAPPTAPTPTPTSPPTPSPNPLASPDQQILRIYCCATDPRSLRPQAASGSDELSIIDGLERGLLYRDGAGNLVPSLATALPTVSADGLTYTYTLRNARYSDGTPIVAADIVRAARDLADPRNAFDLGYLMCYVKGAHDLLGKDLGCPEGVTPYEDPAAGTFDDATIEGLLDQLGVTAPDDHTVVFTLYKPTSFWPDITATWLLTPVPESAPHYWAEASDVISSGPFVLSEWRHNSLMVLTPSPNWYGLPPTLQRIEVHIGGDPASAVANWERGELDEVLVPSSDALRVLGTAAYFDMTHRSNTLSVEYYDFATCQSSDILGEIICPSNEAVTDGVVGGSPMQNVHFRQALTKAVDKADLVNMTFAGIGVPAYSPTMPGISGFPTVTAENTPLPFDPAVALVDLGTALGELGVAAPDPADVPPATDGCDSTCQHTQAWAKMLGPMRFGYNCDASHEQQVLYMAEQWRQLLGITRTQLNVRCTDFGGWPSRGPSRVYDIKRNGWGADFPHPDDQDRGPFACGMRDNESGYCNPAFDALLEEGAHAASYAASLPFYHQAEERLVQDAPVLFLRYGESISLVRPWVISYFQTPADHQNVGDLFYETIQIAAH